MDRTFDKNILHIFAKALIEASNNIQYTGDISDLGNEIGYHLTNLYANWGEQDTQAVLSGIRHGIDLKQREIKLGLK